MAAGGPGITWQEALAELAAHINARFDQLEVMIQALTSRVEGLEAEVFQPPPVAQNPILQGMAARVVNMNPVPIVQVAVGQAAAPAILPPEEAEQ